MDAVRRKTVPTLDVSQVRSEFPILGTRVRGRPLVYLDSAATTQKPRCVLDAIQDFYASRNSNVHRGVHYLSELATEAYEGARARAARFLNAADPREIVFVRGTTEAINLVAQSYLRPRLRPGDEILITHMEHHSNIVPWQLLREATGAALRVVPIDEHGDLDLDALEQMITDRVRFVSVTHVSNALGTVNPVRKIVRLAHERGVPVLLDGAQAVSRLPVDVQELQCDFYAFSGHKIYGPTGIGVLYGRAELLEAMPPYQGGGEMIRSVRFEKTEFNDIPHRFEAGTPHIAGAVGLGAALEYVSRLGLDAISAYEDRLLASMTEAAREIAGLRIIGTARRKAGVLSFVMKGVHPHDIGTVLDMEGVAVRAGHHCAQPVMERFGVPATARASLGVYNDDSDVEALIRGLRKVREVFGS